MPFTGFALIWRLRRANISEITLLKVKVAHPSLFISWYLPFFPWSDEGAMCICSICYHLVHLHYFFCSKKHQYGLASPFMRLSHSPSNVFGFSLKGMLVSFHACYCKLTKLDDEFGQRNSCHPRLDWSYWSLVVSADTVLAFPQVVIGGDQSVVSCRKW